MHLKLHIIHPGVFISDTDIEVKHYQWTWQPNQMFPNYNTKAFNDTMNNLEETSSIAIDYVNHEIKIKQDSQEQARLATQELIQEEKDSENIQIHSDITFWLLIAMILILAIVATYFATKNMIQRKVRNSRREPSREIIPISIVFKNCFILNN